MQIESVWSVSGQYWSGWEMNQKDPALTSWLSTCETATMKLQTTIGYGWTMDYEDRFHIFLEKPSLNRTHLRF